MQPIAINTEYKTPRYKWVCYSDDTAFEDKSDRVFDTIEECHKDMQDHALEKMKWNTNYADGDYNDCTDNCFDGITYKVFFARNMIIHQSYSGGYVYKIVGEFDNPTISDIFTKDVVDFMLRRGLTEFKREYFRCYGGDYC